MTLRVMPNKTVQLDVPGSAQLVVQAHEGEPRKVVTSTKVTYCLSPLVGRAQAIELVTELLKRALTKAEADALHEVAQPSFEEAAAEEAEAKAQDREG
jgi:hypothetical protein